MPPLKTYAHYVKTSLDLAKIEQKTSDLPLFNLVRKERNLLLYSLGEGEGKYLCIFSFGVVVICGIEDPKEAAKLLKRVTLGEEDIKVGRVDPEEFDIVVNPDQPESLEFHYVQIKDLKVEKLLLIFHTMAQSAALSFLDMKLGDPIRSFEEVHTNLEQSGHLHIQHGQLMKMVGVCGNMINLIVGRLALLDDPAITWEDKEAEALYVKMRQAFELDDRFNALQFKLEFIQDSSQRILDVLAAKRSEWLEIIIIVLIVIEVLLWFVDFLRPIAH
jgi:uncharacterized Rmd1/YagE family protein